LIRLSRHRTGTGPRWAAEGRWLNGLDLTDLLSLRRDQIAARVSEALGDVVSGEPLLAPVNGDHEIWASGVTYLRSRDARRHESSVADVYERVYDADRPELFFKSPGFRVRGPGEAIRVRRDASWTVPEPELVLVINAHGEIVGYSAGNDVSSRDIEGENPLYLPQAKLYDGSCALGPWVALCAPDKLQKLAIELSIERGGAEIFRGQTSVAQMKRSLEELTGYLFRELSFPHGVFLMTGTGIVPPDHFGLKTGDQVTVRVGTQTLVSPVG
jgi:2-dehydro-3-deoxy-D-arabinonate dehydratase